MAKVKKYFGDIPPGPSLIRPELNIAKRTEDTRGYYEDIVPEAKITMVWNVPQWGSRKKHCWIWQPTYCRHGKTSRLYKKLVYEDQTASSATAYIDPMEIAGNVYMEATGETGQDC